MPESPRAKYLKRFQNLKAERVSWLNHWRELAENFSPRRWREFLSDSNRGDKRNAKIINGTPLRACRILSSGLMAGLTSPSRPWFELTTPDPQMAEVTGIRSWLDLVRQAILQAIAKSNTYNALHTLYCDLPLYGTGALHVDEDQEDILRAYCFPAGQYALGNSARLQVDTLYREDSLTAGQLVQRFGRDKCSPQVRTQFDQGNVDARVNIVHAIQPRLKRDAGKADFRNMAWESAWFESGADSSTGSLIGSSSGSIGGSGDWPELLEERGYETFPVMAPRWNVTGSDVYGSSPAMDALGDAKQLQQLERRKAQALDKIVNPPMVGPSSLRHTRLGLNPGDMSYVDTPAGQAGLRPAIEVNPQAVPLTEASIRDVQQRINELLGVDMFLMVASSAGDGNRTAREVAELHEEKLLQLGPMLERVEDELLDPLIERVYGILLRRGMIPDPPAELQGVELKVKYISIMAQAQKLVGVTAIERLASFAGNLAAVKPEVLDKIDFDEAIDRYADALGVSPDIVRADDAVAGIRQQRAQQQAQAQAQQQAITVAQGAQTLSQTDTSGDNALTRLLGSLGPAASAGAMSGAP